jgi:hypothetical protein
MPPGGRSLLDAVPPAVLAPARPTESGGAVVPMPPGERSSPYVGLLSELLLIVLPPPSVLVAVGASRAALRSSASVRLPANASRPATSATPVRHPIRLIGSPPWVRQVRPRALHER